MAAPSTDWKEVIADDEEAKCPMSLATLSKMQNKYSEICGAPGRCFHRKQVLAVPATLTVLDDPPEPCRHGMFAKAKTYSANIRISNGHFKVGEDKVPDIRGFAVKVKGVSGASAMGDGAQTSEQDFLMINADSFGLKTGDELVSLVRAKESDAGMLSKMFTLFGDLGLGMFSRIKAFKAAKEKPFSGFATETFNTCAPMACGPYACRVFLTPASKLEPNKQVEDVDWAKDFKAHLEKGDVEYDVQLQFFTDEESTPIADHRLPWSAPLVKVGKLKVAKDAAKKNNEAFSEEVEKSSFSPWNALMEHRPLGNVNRLRKHAYAQSFKQRDDASK